MEHIILRTTLYLRPTLREKAAPTQSDFRHKALNQMDSDNRL